MTKRPVKKTKKSIHIDDCKKVWFSVGDLDDDSAKTSLTNSVDVVLGLQYGDEGKGKIVSYLSRYGYYAACVRSTGGPNAGHTVWPSDNKKLVLHQIPTGIIHGTTAIIAEGCFIDPVKLCEEIEYLESNGIKVEGKLLISSLCHVIMPWHIEEDSHDSSEIGTTGQGIGPCASQKYSRVGIRLGKLVEMCHLQADGLSRGSIYEEKLKQQAKAVLKLENYVEYSSTYAILSKLMSENASQFILLEGSQGYELDINSPNYPYVTSSNVTTSGLLAGANLPPSCVRNVYGVMKPYTTYVGSSPGFYPADKHVSEKIVELGNEFGSTTGRKRMIGEFDQFEIKDAIRVNGVNKLVLCKLDVFIKAQDWFAKNSQEDNSFFQFFGKDLFVKNKLQMSYNSKKPKPFSIAEYISYAFNGVPISLVSYGKTDDETEEFFRECDALKDESEWNRIVERILNENQSC